MHLNKCLAAKFSCRGGVKKEKKASQFEQPMDAMKFHFHLYLLMPVARESERLQSAATAAA